MKQNTTNSFLQSHEQPICGTQLDEEASPSEAIISTRFLTQEERSIHQRSRDRSPNPGQGLGVCELFTASSADREVILTAVKKGRILLALYLLGTDISEWRIANEAAEMKHEIAS